MADLENIIPEIVEFAQEHLPNDILHGWAHIERVLKYARLVNKELHGDWGIIHAAILLHDIGHSEDREHHHEISAQKAEIFLKDKQIDDEIIFKIQECILSHSRQYAETKPGTTEAKAVYDADGMDLFGPIGLMRALLSCALQNKGFACILKKLQWRINEKRNFYSREARIFVEENSGSISNYLFRLQKQLEFLSRL
jgi:HD superfamily phosphodiesterase